MSTIFGSSRIVLYIPPNYVTTNTDQSINGLKTFTSLVTCTDSLASNDINTESLTTNEIVFADNTIQTTAALSPPTGSITMFGSFNIPAGWVLCDGTQYSITDPRYSRLYNVIGYSYNFAATLGFFRVPDFRGVYPGMPGTNLTIQNYSPFTTSLFSGPSTMGEYQLQSVPLINHTHTAEYPNNTNEATDSGVGVARSFYRSGSSQQNATTSMISPTAPNSYTNIGNNITPVSLGINYIIKL